MDDDEAREVLERMDRMAAEGASSGDSDADSEDEMELDLTDAPVRLAENGYELLVTRDDGTRVRIGPRELRRYYKQRPRPDDDRAMVLAARANEEARGMARLGETRAGERGLAAFDASGKFSLPHISIMVKRAQKAARKYERNNMFQGNSSIKKFDLNGQNVKVKLPKACPY
jgi:pre-60S factor REI1